MLGHLPATIALTRNHLSDFFGRNSRILPIRRGHSLSQFDVCTASPCAKFTNVSFIEKLLQGPFHGRLADIRTFLQ